MYAGPGSGPLMAA
ncbi:hypothetical protein BB734_08440, partial [Mycobacterium avium subsp. hominissuis]